MLPQTETVEFVNPIKKTAQCALKGTSVLLTAHCKYHVLQVGFVLMVHPLYHVPQEAFAQEIIHLQ